MDARGGRRGTGSPTPSASGSGSVGAGGGGGTGGSTSARHEARRMTLSDMLTSDAPSWREQGSATAPSPAPAQSQAQQSMDQGDKQASPGSSSSNTCRANLSNSVTPHIHMPNCRRSGRSPGSPNSPSRLGASTRQSPTVEPGRLGREAVAVSHWEQPVEQERQPHHHHHHHHPHHHHHYHSHTQHHNPTPPPRMQDPVPKNLHSNTGPEIDGWHPLSRSDVLPSTGYAVRNGHGHVRLNNPSHTSTPPPQQLHSLHRPSTPPFSNPPHRSSAQPLAITDTSPRYPGEGRHGHGHGHGQGASPIPVVIPPLRPPSTIEYPVPGPSILDRHARHDTHTHTPPSAFFTPGIPPPRVRSWNPEVTTAYDRGWDDALAAVSSGIFSIDGVVYQRVPIWPRPLPRSDWSSRDRDHDRDRERGDLDYPEHGGHGHDERLRAIQRERERERIDWERGYPRSTYDFRPYPYPFPPERTRPGPVPRTPLDYRDREREFYAQRYQPQMVTSTPLRHRQMISCHRCRSRKVKCSGGRPCEACKKIKRPGECHYEETIRRRGKGKKGQNGEEVKREGEGSETGSGSGSGQGAGGGSTSAIASASASASGDARRLSGSVLGLSEEPREKDPVVAGRGVKRSRSRSRSGSLSLSQSQSQQPQSQPSPSPILDRSRDKRPMVNEVDK